MTNIIPFGNRILVRPIEKMQVLVQDDGALSEYGEVLSIGMDVVHVKVGQTVGFSVFGVEKLVIDEQKYYFLQESPEFLLAIIEEEPNA